LAVGTGVLVALVVWLLFSMISAAALSVSAALDSGLGGGDDEAVVQEYYSEETTTANGGEVITCYQPRTESGDMDLDQPCYRDLEEVPVPDWYTEAEAAADEQSTEDEQAVAGATVGDQLTQVSNLKLFLSLSSGLLVMIIIGSWFGKEVDKFNARVDHSDINDHVDDQHIALPEELQRKFDWFPDAGAHSAVQANSMISHMMLKQKGLGSVKVAQRAEKDVLDEDGSVVYYAGEAMDDEDGETLTKKMP